MSGGSSAGAAGGVSWAQIRGGERRRREDSDCIEAIIVRVDDGGDERWG